MSPTPKKFLWLPYVKGIVRAQGYAGLGEALDTYNPAKEFVVLASINMVRACVPEGAVCGAAPPCLRFGPRCRWRAEQVDVFTAQGLDRTSPRTGHAAEAGDCA